MFRGRKERHVSAPFLFLDAWGREFVFVLNERMIDSGADNVFLVHELESKDVRTRSVIARAK
jgi:hypothetical protein